MTEQVLCALLRSSNSLRWWLTSWVCLKLVAPTHAWFLILCSLSHSFTQTDMCMRHIQWFCNKSIHLEHAHLSDAHTTYLLGGQMHLGSTSCIHTHSRSEHTQEASRSRHIQDVYLCAPNKYISNHVGKHAHTQRAHTQACIFNVHTDHAHTGTHTITKHTPRALKTQAHEERTPLLSMCTHRIPIMHTFPHAY